MASFTRFCSDVRYIVRKHKSFRRAEVLRSYLGLNVAKYVPFKRRVNFMGMTIYYYRAKQLLGLVKEIFIRTPYAFKTSKKVPVIIDCGSNIGVSVLFFKKLYPKARVMAFEANPEAFELLEKNVLANKLKDVKLIHCAVANKKGTIDLHLDGDDKASVFASIDPGRRNSEAKKLARVVSVPARKLSSYIKGQIDFLKIDVEGAELGVFQDLSTSGKISKIKEMIIEYHHHIRKDEDQFSQLLSILESHGFGYQIEANFKDITRKGRFQDILIYAYKKP